MRNRRLAALAALAVGAGAIAFAAVTPASAASGSFADDPAETPIEVDGASIDRVIAVDLPGTISDVNVTLDFEKAPEMCVGAPPWATNGWNEEMNVDLVSPQGTRVTLIKSAGWESEEESNTGATYPSSTWSERVTVVLDDQAGTVVGNPQLPDSDDRRPESGTFRTAGNVLDSLIGEDAAGDWIIELSDDALWDPLCYYGAVLEIETRESTAPEPPAEPQTPTRPTPPARVSTGAR